MYSIFMLRKNLLKNIFAGFIILFFVFSNPTFIFTVSNAEASNDYALRFDGIDDYALVPHHTSLDPESGSFTITFWVKLDSAKQDISKVWDVILDKRPVANRGYFVGSNREYCNEGQAGMNFMLGNTSNNRVDTHKGNTDYLCFNLDEWTFFTAVLDRTGNQMRLSKNADGEWVTNTPPTGSISANIGVGIGKTPYNNSFHSSGFIKDLRMWNVALTQSEIESIMLGEIIEDGQVARWPMDEGSGSSLTDVVNGRNGVIHGATWASLSLPPDEPILNFPADETLGVSTSPTLSVNVSDYEEDDLIVTFYGRKYFETANDFTIMTLPDTQSYSQSYPSTFLAQTQWIVDNIDDLNIKMVLHKGDIVQNGYSEAQWANAMAALNILKNNNIPTLVSIGNHDYDDEAVTRGAVLFNTNIAYDEWYEEKSWFDGGFYEAGSSENVYTRLSFDGFDYLFMTLEFGPRQSVIDWANQVVADHPDHQIMIVTHTYMYSDNTRHTTGHNWNPHVYGVGSDAHDGEEMWNELMKSHENIFFVVNGHVLNTGLGRLTSVGDNGNTVHQILANYQAPIQPNGGNGWLRYYVFSPKNNHIYAYTYSPTLEAFNTSSGNEFVLNYDFYPDDDYVQLGIKTDVVSGSNVEHEWVGLEEGTRYEWYVTVSDGVSTVKSDVWTFTTILDEDEDPGDPDPEDPQPPQVIPPRSRIVGYMPPANLANVFNTEQATQSLITQYKDILIQAYNMGIIFPQNVLDLLGISNTVPILPERDLRFGDRGEDVKVLQTILINQGYRILADGIFGNQTRQALSEYQKRNNISPAQGYFGPVTRAQMKGAGLFF